MFAVIKTGGKQYRVASDSIIDVERLEGEQGGSVEFDQVLMVGEGANVEIGKPLLEGRKVKAEILEQKRGPKLIAFKKIRRQGKERKVGHRQNLTRVKITSV